jgi:hypothetical protein
LCEQNKRERRKRYVFGHVCFAVNAKEGRKGTGIFFLLLTSIVQSELERIFLSLSLSLSLLEWMCVCIWGGKKRLEGERKITNRGDCDFEGLRELWRSSKNCFWDNCDVDQNILLLASSKTCRFSKNKTIKTLFSVKLEIEEKVNTIGWRPCSNRKPPSDVHLVGIDFLYIF